MFAVCLEVLNTLVNRNHGLSVAPKYAMSVNAARYLPTFGAVCLGFMWKAIVQDAKKNHAVVDNEREVVQDIRLDWPGLCYNH